VKNEKTVSRLSQATKILISLGVMLTYALPMYVAFEIAYPRFYRKWGPFNHPTVIIYIYRTVAVLVTCTVPREMLKLN
jgi:hypothetical protein